jgi:hypothetical protein
VLLEHFGSKDRPKITKEHHLYGKNLRPAPPTLCREITLGLSSRRDGAECLSNQPATRAELLQV